MRVDLYRHGPKNDSPAAHLTGVEALLDPSKINLIKEHAADIARSSVDYETIQVMTTPIERAIATGNIEHDVFVQAGYNAPTPQINALIGSAAIHPETGAAINLSPKSMSKIWGEAKEDDKYGSLRGEHRSLRAWFEQGLDNPQVPELFPCSEIGYRRVDVNDPGISLREIAWRIGTFFYETFKEGDDKTRVVSFGHSGDIEPWLALTLQMYHGNDNGRHGTTTEDMIRIFDEIGGALEPLKGVSIADCSDEDLYLLGPSAKKAYGEEIILKRNILQEQARLFKVYGLSNEVFAARLKLG